MEAVKTLTAQGVPAQLACESLEVSRSSYYASTKAQAVGAKAKRGPSHRALTSDEREKVVDILHSPRFFDWSPAAIVAALLDDGIYLCSVRTIYRILEERDELREWRNIARRASYQKPELLATQENQVWSWDITKLLTHEEWFYFCLYAIIDIFSRYVVGYMVANSESAVLARELVESAYQQQKILPGQLTIHSDRGAAAKSKTLSMLYSDLSIDKSFSRLSVSDDNPFSEAQFKTLKYSPHFPERFASLGDARRVCNRLITWYNTEHWHSSLADYTPSQIHHGLHQELAKMRKKSLAEAYQRNPERFGRFPKPREVPTEVWINKPEQVKPGLTQAIANLAKDTHEKTEGAIFVKK